MKPDSPPTVVTTAIATATVFLAASLAAPDEDDGTIEANETSAVAALETIRAAQERFKAQRVVDLDGDGVGEYGLLRELTRAQCARASADASECGGHADGPLLNWTFAHPVTYRQAGAVLGTGVIVRSGYHFRVLLPGASGEGVVESWQGPLDRPLDTDLAETTWCCYAWPQTYGVTGRRAFFINQTGVVVSADFPRYEHFRGLGTPDRAGAALREGGSPREITGEVAADATGRDGGHWTLVTPRTRERTLRVRGRFGPDSRYGYGLGYPRRFGSLTLTVRRFATRADEMLVCRARGLSRGVAYEVAFRPREGADAVVLGSARASWTGALTFRFDSRSDPFPAGLTSLAAFGGGAIELHRDRDPDGDHTISAVFGPTDEHDDDVPTRTGDAVADNEAAAIASLRRIVAAQDAFVTEPHVDVNRDGRGEYGLLRELTGRNTLRYTADASEGSRRLVPPLLPRSFGAADVNYEVVRAGYRFRVMLPGVAGIGIPEASRGGLISVVDSELAATSWCCYAWPDRYDVTGKRTFFVNELREITATNSARYSGPWAVGTAASAGAAFKAGGLATKITGQVANGATGRDGFMWRALSTRPVEVQSTVTGSLHPVDGSEGPAGSFTLEHLDLHAVTDEVVRVSAHGLPPWSSYSVRLVTASGERSAWDEYLGVGDSGSASTSTSFGAGTVTDFDGGTIEVHHGPHIALRGDIPRFATVAGPNDPLSTLVRHAAATLVPGPNLRLKRGTIDLRTTSDVSGTRAVLTFAVTTFDSLADRADVFAVADGVDTRLGTIRLAGDRGSGTLLLDTSLGDAIPGGSLRALAGQRVEVRDTTGAVLLTGTFPSLD